MENMEKLADLKEEIAIKEMENQIEIPEKDQERPAQIPGKFQAIPYWKAAGNWEFTANFLRKSGSFTDCTSGAKRRGRRDCPIGKLA